MTAKKRFPGLMDMGKKIREPEKMRKGFKLLLLAPLRFATLPIIRKFHPWTRVDKTQVYWLPINKNIASKYGFGRGCFDSVTSTLSND